MAAWNGLPTGVAACAAARGRLPSAVGVLLLVALFIMPAVPPAAAQTSAVNALDLVLLIDDSGSMNLPQFGASDPGGLRYDAASLLIDLLNDDDRIGVVQFARSANNRLGDLRRIGDDRRGLKLRVSGLAAPQEQALQDPTDTRYAPALAVAEQLLRRPDPSRRQAVLLLTDGNPSDAPAAFAALERLQQQGSAVFLLMLQPDLTLIGDAARRTTIQRGIDGVLASFRSAGHSVLEISAPADIARAFATVITQLQPGTYLDTLRGTAGSSATDTTLFTVRTTAAQRLIRADLVVVANRPTTALVVQADQAAGSSPLTLTGSNPRYAVFSSAARDDVLSGEWRLSAATLPDDVSAFAFLRSDVRLRLRYPAADSARTALNGQVLLLGAEIDGLTADAVGDVRLRVNPQRCPTTSAAQADDLPLPSTNSTGLSSTDTTLFWTTARAQGERMYVTIELAPVQSVALWRCAAIELIDGPAPELGIAADVQALQDGRLPVRLTTANVTPASLRLWLQAPDGSVQELPVAADGSALSGPLLLAGRYMLRAVAEGRVNGSAVTVFAERSVAVAGTISSAVTEFDLGPITALDQPLAVTFSLSTPLLARAADLQFPQQQLVLTDRNGARLPLESLELDICSGGRRLVDGVFSCSLRLLPAADLPTGAYQLSVAVSADGQDVRFDRLLFRFERPQSGVRLTLPADLLELPDALSDIRTRLEYPLQAQPVLSAVPARLQETVSVLEVRDSLQRPLDGLPITVRLVADDSSGTRYRLLIEADGPFAAGSYSLRLGFAAEGGAAVFPPEANVLIQRRDVTLVLTPQAPLTPQDSVSGVERYRLDPIFGLNVGPLYAAAVLPLYGEARDARTFPSQLPPLQVVSVRRLDRPETVDRTMFRADWQNNGAVAGRELTERLALRMVPQAWPGLAAGDYEVLLRTDPARIQAPRELLVIVPVRPLWHVLPFVLAVVVAGWGLLWLRDHVTNGFTGDLELAGEFFSLAGNRPHGIVLDAAQGGFNCLPLENGKVAGAAPLATVSSRNRRTIDVRFAGGLHLTLERDRPQYRQGMRFVYRSRPRRRG